MNNKSNFFNEEDIKRMQSKKIETENNLNIKREKEQRIKNAMTYALKCYGRAISEISVLGIPNLWFDTGLAAPYEKHPVFFISSTNGQIKYIDYGGEHRFRKEVKVSVSEMMKMIQVGINQYNHDPDRCINSQDYVYGIGLSSCKIMNDEGGYEIIDALPKKEIKANVKQHILIKIEIIMKGGKIER